MIGMSAPLLGAILAACGSSSSSSGSSSSSSASGGAATKGGTLRVALGPGSRGQPADGRRRGRSVHAQPDRRVPDLRQQPEADAPADAGAELEAEQRTAACGRSSCARASSSTTAQPMTADDVVYTFQQLSDPKNASNALSTFTGVLTPTGVKKVDSTTVAVPPRGAERQLPLPGLVRQLQRDHRPQGHRLRQVAEDVHRHRRVQARQLHAERRRLLRRQPQLLGHQAAAGRHAVQVLRQPAADDPRAPGQRRRRDRAVRARRAAAILLNNPSVQDHPAQVGQPPRAVDAQRPARRSTTRGCARRSRTRSTARGWSTALLSGYGSVANDYPFGPRFPSTDTQRPAARRRTSPRPSSCWPPPVIPTGSRARCTPSTTRRSRSWRR